MIFEDARYNRQLMMPEWGLEGQAKLARSATTVIGAGGVKSSLLMCLAAAGVGRIRLVEFDRIELSNLNRQTLYRTSQIGRPKVEAAAELLRDLNPEITIESVNRRFDESSAADLISDADFIVEGGDSPFARNLVNEACLRLNKPFVHASAQFSYGYVFSVVPAWRTACFACFFPRDHTRTETTGAVPVNVLSVHLAGTLGAAEVLKYLLGHTENMHVNRRLCFSSLLLSGRFEVIEQPRREECPVCGRCYSGQDATPG